LKQELRGWFADMNKFRAHFYSQLTRGDIIIRYAHVGINPPAHYHKPNGELACDAVEKLPTMRSLIHALTK
jgi:hypothetical protein